MGGVFTSVSEVAPKPVNKTSESTIAVINSGVIIFFIINPPIFSFYHFAIVLSLVVFISFT